MATASSNPDSAMKAMENELSCYICFNLLREPKDPDCPHTYCLLCLQDWVGKKPTIDCPECRHITNVPPGGLSKLKNNLRLKNMVEMYSVHVGKQKDVPICQNHEGERQHFFCVTCGVTVCRDCLVLDHQLPRHEIKELKVITKTLKTEMKVKLHQVQAEVRKVEEDEKKLGEIKRQVQVAKEQAKSKLEKCVQLLVAEVEAKGKETAQRIEAIYEERLKAIGEEEKSTKERGTRLRNVCSASQNVVDTAADHVYMKQHASLVDKMENLCVAQRDVQTWSDMACFHFDPVSTILLGKLYQKIHKKLQLTLFAEFGKFQQALGVVATRTGLLAVADYESKLVTVYRFEKGRYKRQFCLGVLSDNPDGKLTLPCSVADTSDNKFLVIDEWTAVKVFSPTGKYERKFSMQGSIITTKDDKIVIGSSANNIITVQKSSGDLLRTHQIGSGNLSDIAANGKQIAFTKPHEGQLRVIDSESGQDLWTLDMTFPTGVCFEENSNSILVAGNSKKKEKFTIDQYCSTTGRFVSRLARGLHNPLAMTITPDGKLAVADMKSVKIYNIE